MKRPPTYPRLRVRRLGSGFDREDVLFALRELEDTLRRIEAELDLSRLRQQDLETELRAAQAEAAALRAHEARVAEAIASAERHARELEETAEARGKVVVAEAEEQAAKIRGEAHLKIESTGKQLEDLLELKGKTIVSMRSIVSELDRTIGRIERGEGSPTVPAAEPESEPAEHERTDGPAAEFPDEPLFERRVEVDAGPFADFGALSAFERSLARLPSVEDVYVRRFFDDRAIVELTTSEELPLLAELRTALPYAFEAERIDRGAVRITLSSSLAETL